MVRVVSFGEGQVGESGVLAPLKVTRGKTHGEWMGCARYASRLRPSSLHLFIPLPLPNKTDQGLEVGDVAYTKQPWGIGPRDDTFDGRKFSFVRQNDVLARINA